MNGNVIGKNKVSPFVGDNAMDALQNAAPAVNGEQKVVLINEVVAKSKDGDMVFIKGQVLDMPEDSKLILNDASGKVKVDIDDAQNTLHLSKGDKVAVKGKVNKKDNAIEIEAVQIEKQ